MTIFAVQFETASAYATHEIEAATPAQALDLARALATHERDSLDFAFFDEIGEVEQLEARAADGALVGSWTHPDAVLRAAASELLAAAEDVLAAWEHGDLAEAVRRLASAVAEAKAG